MTVDELVRSPGAWLSMEQATDVVMSSRVRLARNVKGFPFPSGAGEQDRRRLRDRLRAVFERLKALPGATVMDLDALGSSDLEVLEERHLISPELADKPAGSALVISPDESVAIMVNEEDHLRLQAMNPGLSLRQVWERIDGVDTELERHVSLAFSAELGYLTACPTNVGTGLRAGVMLHLPGLRMLGEMDAVTKGLNSIGFEVRGLLGEGTAAHGDMFQVSNRATLGVAEEQVISRMLEIVAVLVQHERNARGRLHEERTARLRDYVGRAYGTLRYAQFLTSQEVMDMLSALRLGLEYGFVAGVAGGRLNEVMLSTQPGHLQKMAGRALESEDRDQLRAAVTRERLGDLVLK